MRGVPSRPWAIRLLLAASLALAATFIVLRQLGPSDGIRVPFYRDAWTSGGVILDRDEASAGLRAGDLVTGVDGRSLAAWADGLLDPAVTRPNVRRTATASAAVSYEVVRDGASLTVPARWQAPRLAEPLVEAWGVVVFALAFAVIAAFVHVRRPDRPASTALLLAACGASGSSLPWAIGVTLSDLVQGPVFVLHALITGPLYMLLWPAALHLALVFPAPAAPVVRWPRLVPAIYAVVLGVYGLGMLVTRLLSTRTLDWIGSWPTVQTAILVPTLVLTVALMVRSYVSTRDPAGRARLRWATYGTAISAVLGLSAFMLPELVLGRALLPDAWIGITALPVPIGLATGILRDQLFDIDVAINRTLVYGGLTGGVIATYLGATAVMFGFVGTDRGEEVSLLAAGLAALAALPLRDALQRAVNRVMYGQRDEPWEAMRTLGQRLEWAAEPERAFPAIVETIADALRLPYAALELAEADGAWRTAAERGEARGEIVRVPVAQGAEPVARLVLGIRSGERDFRPDDRRLIEDLARQAASAIQALQLREDLVRSREDLVLAREEERRRLRRDLHDGLGPALAAIGLRAEASAATVRDDPAAAAVQLQDMSGEIGLALGEVRRLVEGLRPPALDELGLVGAIRQQAERLERGDGAGTPAARIAVLADAEDGPPLPAAIEVAAYRIAVEAITNVVRHARATRCVVRLARGDELTIDVTDDGCGIGSDARPGVGLESMHARAAELGGRLVVDGPPTGGTRVRAWIPLSAGRG